MDWTSIVETLGIAGILAFVAKGLIKYWLDKGVERYKQELKSHNDAEIERLRSELRVEAFKHETKFAKLHERRAEVIEEIYKRLSRMHAAFSDYLSPIQQILEGQTHEDKMRNAAELVNDFINYFDERKIFLDVSLCNKTEDLILTFRRTWSESGAIKEEFRGTKWSDVWKEFHDKVPPIKSKIEAKFRNMLGIEGKEDSDEENN